MKISSIVNLASFYDSDLVLAKIKNKLDLDSKPFTKVEQSHLRSNKQSWTVWEPVGSSSITTNFISIE